MDLLVFSPGSFKEYILRQMETHTAFYVSTGGDDRWSGRLPAPEANQNDGPFATLTRARQAVRELKAQGDLPGPVDVLLRGGKYFLDQPVVLGSEDSGTHSCPVSYRAYPGEVPIDFSKIGIRPKKTT